MEDPLSWWGHYWRWSHTRGRYNNTSPLLRDYGRCLLNRLCTQRAHAELMNFGSFLSPRYRRNVTAGVVVVYQREFSETLSLSDYMCYLLGVKKKQSVLQDSLLSERNVAFVRQPPSKTENRKQ